MPLRIFKYGRVQIAAVSSDQRWRDRSLGQVVAFIWPWSWTWMPWQEARFERAAIWVRTALVKTPWRGFTRVVNYCQFIQPNFLFVLAIRVRLSIAFSAAAKSEQLKVFPSSFLSAEFGKCVGLNFNQLRNCLFKRSFEVPRRAFHLLRIFTFLPLHSLHCADRLIERKGKFHLVAIYLQFGFHSFAFQLRFLHSG